MTKLIPLLPLAAALAGCGDEFLREEASPAFSAGYEDGCGSGTAAASNLTGRGVRDETRYNADPEYATGWRNGYRACDGAELQSNPYNSMEPVDLDGPQ